MNRDQILQLLDAVDDRFVTESTRFDPAQRPTERSAHMKSKRILTFALAAVLLLGLGAVAYAAGWIGPRAIVLEGRSAYTAQRQEDGSVSVRAAGSPCPSPRRRRRIWIRPSGRSWRPRRPPGPSGRPISRKTTGRAEFRRPSSSPRGRTPAPWRKTTTAASPWSSTKTEA